MGDYIEREVIQKRLNRIVEVNNLRADLAWFTPYGVKALIEEIPAADVRPVVLCRDCKWTETDGMEEPAIYCKKWDRWEMPLDGFCWLGRKRGES